MKIITQDYENDKKISSSIVNFFKIYKISVVLKASNAYKKKVFQYLFSLIFANRTMYMNMLTSKLLLTSEQLEQLMDAFISALPNEIKGIPPTIHYNSYNILKQFIQ